MPWEPESELEGVRLSTSSSVFFLWERRYEMKTGFLSKKDKNLRRTRRLGKNVAGYKSRILKKMKKKLTKSP